MKRLIRSVGFLEMIDDLFYHTDERLIKLESLTKKYYDLLTEFKVYGKALVKKKMSLQELTDIKDRIELIRLEKEVRLEEYKKLKNKLTDIITEFSLYLLK